MEQIAKQKGSVMIMAEYIDREALLRSPIRIDNYDKENGNENFVFGIEAVLEYAEHIPTADVVEVKRGKWKVDETHDYEPYCSLCGHEPIAGEKYNYCPDCGADMRGDSK
jgi:hypothetical protein|nr:MAG TPA: DNA-directed RNA polymerase [Caudoviricetes sp.]